MKILQVIPMFKLAGAETMCENLCYALVEMGCDVIAVSLYTKHTSITDRLEKAGVKVIYLGKKRGFDYTILAKLYKLIKVEKPDVVHTHINAARYSLPVATFCSVTCKVHTVHNIAQKEQTKAGKIINGIMFKYFDAIPVALSGEIKKTIQDVYHLSPEKIPTIYNGINLSKCIPKKEYNSKKYFIILHIGRFFSQKNHCLILKSFAQFVSQHPEARLQLLGDGELKNEMEQLSKALGLAETVQFAGLQSDVYSWLHNADIFILPSEYEGMPMSLIEAMGTGLPIVASAVGGIPDMLSNGKNAILIEPTTESLLKAMEKLYSDYSLRETLGKKVKEKSEDFSYTNMAKKYIKIYRKQLALE